METKQKITIHIAGKDVTLISDEDPAYLRRVAAYVDRKMNETARAMRSTSQAAAVMTAISLGDELMQAQDENRFLRSRVRELEQKLNDAQ